MISYFPSLWLFLNNCIIILFILVVQNCTLVAYYNINLKMTQPYKNVLRRSSFLNTYLLLLFFQMSSHLANSDSIIHSLHYLFNDKEVEGGEVQ